MREVARAGATITALMYMHASTTRQCHRTCMHARTVVGRYACCRASCRLSCVLWLCKPALNLLDLAVKTFNNAPILNRPQRLPCKQVVCVCVHECMYVCRWFRWLMSWWPPTGPLPPSSHSACAASKTCAACCCSTSPWLCRQQVRQNERGVGGTEEKGGKPGGSAAKHLAACAVISRGVLQGGQQVQHYAGLAGQVRR